MSCVISYSTTADGLTNVTAKNLLLYWKEAIIARFQIGSLHGMFQSSAANILQGGSNMTGTDLYVNKPHCAAAVRP